MGNKILKVLLPLLVLAVIIVVLIRTRKPIEDMAPSTIRPFEFAGYVDSIIQTDLEGQPYAQARDEYRRIYDIIKTEKNIVSTDMAGDQKSLLPDSTAQVCYCRAFAAYWPAFEGMAESVFKSDWSNKTSQLDVISKEAVSLQKREGTSLRNDSISRYLAYVNEYKTISNFASSVSCKSASTYDELVSNKNHYKKKYPFCNNRSLLKELDDVPEKAKNAWKKNVVWYVEKTCSAPDLEQFLNGFVVEVGTKKKSYETVGKSVCDEKIADFHSRFNGELSDQNDRLRMRWHSLLTVAVEEACNNAYDYNTFYLGDYSKLSKIVADYGNDARLQEKLDGKLRQLLGY